MTFFFFLLLVDLGSFVWETRAFSFTKPRLAAVNFVMSPLTALRETEELGWIGGGGGGCKGSWGEHPRPEI